MGRMSLENLQCGIGIDSQVNQRTILCSDANITYQAFCREKGLEHQVLNASKGERVHGIYHIQHVNALHSNLKGLLNYHFRGVSTKYLQKYLNWQMIKEKLKDELFNVSKVLKTVALQHKAMKTYNQIALDYYEKYPATLK